MAYQVRQTTATIPANTAKSAPVTVDLVTGYWDVTAVGLTVPSGPSGLMGFQLWIGGGQWIPFDSGEYIVWDDVTELWELDDQPAGQAWSVVGYNLDDVFAHSVQVRFHIDTVASPTPPAPTLTVIQSTPAPVEPVTL